MSQIEGRGDSGNTNMSLSISLGGGLGGAGGAGGAGNTVSVTNQGTITTWGDAAHGIFAQSVGGGGGVGGASSITKSSPGSGNSISLNAVIGGGAGVGGNGSNVMVWQEGDITTYGEGAYGIFAQSVGGGGGMGGTAKIETESGHQQRLTFDARQWPRLLLQPTVLRPIAIARNGALIFHLEWAAAAAAAAVAVR